MFFGIRQSVEWTVLFILTGFAIWLRFYKLGHLGLWGDEGFTALSVEGILKHGYPLLPSGNAYLKDILFSYFSAILPFIAGMTEFTLRFANAFWGVALIPLFYFVSKKFFPLPLALLGALLLTLNHWEIEFARHARYYCQLQFFYLLTLYFFYTGFVEDKKRDQWLALLFFVLACLTHQLAYTLVFSFLVLFCIKGPLVFLRTRALLFAVLFAFVVMSLQMVEVYFWKVGSVAHLEEGKSVWQVMFRDFHWGYFKQFRWLFPAMSWVAAFGGVVFLFRRREPLSFFMAMGILTLIFMGFGQAHFQPRYIFFLFPLFLLAYLAGLYFIFILVQRTFQRLSLGGGKLFGLVAASAVLFFSLDAVNPQYSVRIPKHRYGKRLIEKFQPSTTFVRRIDYKTPAEYVRTHAQPEDLILGMHMIYQYIYAGRCDYWLWSAGKGAWDAYIVKEGVPYDRYLGIPLIRNLAQFKDLLRQTKNRVWVITTPSWNDRGHIQPELARYLINQPDKIQYHSQDGSSKVFLFE